MLQRDLFETIFGDAHIKDIDLSAWDKRISLYVLADHTHLTADGKKPLFLVEFSAVSEISITFNHLSFDLDHTEDEHVQWRVRDFRISETGTGWEIEMSGYPSSPSWRLTCEGITIREIPHSIPNRLFPKWSKPGSGFIRPGLEKMAAELGNQHS